MLTARSSRLPEFFAGGCLGRPYPLPQQEEQTERQHDQPALGPPPPREGAHRRGGNDQEQSGGQLPHPQINCRGEAKLQHFFLRYPKNLRLAMEGPLNDFCASLSRLMKCMYDPPRTF